MKTQFWNNILEFSQLMVNCFNKMKKNITIVIFFFCATYISAQSTWFKFVPGWQCNNTIIQKDTIYAFCPSSLTKESNVTMGFNLNKVDLKTGNVHQSDSLFYYSKKLNQLTDLEYRSQFNALELGNNHFLIGSNYFDSIKTTINKQADIFEYPGFKKLNCNINYDTFKTEFEGLFNIHGINYAFINWIRVKDRLTSIENSRIYKLNQDGNTKLIYENLNKSNNSKQRLVNCLIGDNLNNQNLLLSTRDQWDWWGLPASFEAVVIKLDTNGNKIWECKPIGDQDSINTTGFQMVQLPNGNILCSWLDLYYRAYKNPQEPNTYFESANDNSTIWFAEIDYTTGKKLWTKNIQQYLTWKMAPIDMIGVDSYNDLIFTHSKLLSNNSIVWCGYRSNFYEVQQSWKYLPVILKTDLTGNPIWYREYNIFPLDKGDKGFSVVSFTETPDHGFLLSGQYVNQFGQMTNGEVWQKAALLKLDSNGCFTPGCNAYDKVINIVAPKQICNVFPSPANDLININYPEKSRENWKVEIIDITGKLLFQSDENPIRVITAQFPDGNYYINFTNIKTNHYETHQVIVKH
jgi:hypothetical protein